MAPHWGHQGIGGCASCNSSPHGVIYQAKRADKEIRLNSTFFKRHAPLEMNLYESVLEISSICISTYPCSAKADEANSWIFEPYFNVLLLLIGYVLDFCFAAIFGCMRFEFPVWVFLRRGRDGGVWSYNKENEKNEVHYCSARLGCCLRFRWLLLSSCK